MSIKDIKIEVSEGSWGKIISFIIKGGMQTDIRLAPSIEVEDLPGQLRGMADALEKHLATASTCKHCGANMADDNTETCSPAKKICFPDGEILPAVRYQDEEGSRCHDCNIAPGGFHHPGCSVERCPRCGGQLISCECLDEEV